MLKDKVIMGYDNAADPRALKLRWGKSYKRHLNELIPHKHTEGKKEKRILRRKASIFFTAIIGLCLLSFCCSERVQAASVSQNNNRFVPGEIIVKFKPMTSKGNIAAMNMQMRMGIKKRIPLIDAYHIKVPPGLSVSEAVRLYNGRPDLVEYAEPNYIIHEAVSPDDPGFSEQWGLENTGQNGGLIDADINAVSAWNIETGNKDVIVAIIDSGVDITHPDLINNIYTNTGEIPGNGIDDDGNGFIDDLHGWDFVDADNIPQDGRGHGTHVAGIIAATGNNMTGVSGIAWNVSILPLKFINDCCGQGTLLDVVSAINYAIAMNADVINASWGSYDFSLALKDIIKAANNAGILFAAASGNDSLDTDTTPLYPAGYNLPNIISVASTDRFDNRSSFSNFGIKSVDLGSPGSSILSTRPTNPATISFGSPPAGLNPTEYGTISGTSMATPFVAGTAALIISQYPGATVQYMRSKILGGTEPLSSLNGITATGGRLNAFNSLTLALSKVSGRVMDSNGNRIKKARVILKNRDIGEVMKVWTNQKGFYRFRDLMPGRYKIVVKKKGFTRGIVKFKIKEGKNRWINVIIDPVP
ncbi:MAG: S8 family serine peptidase [Nitrospirota bacterium]